MLASAYLNPQKKYVEVCVRKPRGNSKYTFEYSKVPFLKAVKMLDQGAAIIVSPYLIFKLLHRREFHPFIMNRDRHTCRYCRKPATTIDHLVPRCKGGISSPVNCVAACKECNHLKADSSVISFISRYNRYHPVRDWSMEEVKC